MSETRLPSRFSIAHKGPAKGREYESWREGICRGFCRLDVSPVEENQIDCQNDFVLIDQVAMATPTGRSARFARTPDLLQDGCDDLVLISATGGPTRVTQKGKVIDLEAGQMCLTEMNVVGTAELTARGGFTTTRFPRHTLLQSFYATEDYIAQPLIRDQFQMTMVDRYFKLCSEIAVELDPTGRTMASRHLADLVGHMLSSTGLPENIENKHNLLMIKLNLVKDHIRRNISDSNLSIHSVVRFFGISERKLQRLFALSGTTFSEFVLEKRLSLAQCALADASTGRKISDIAYAVGFNDLSYFNRSFRKQFGMTPSESIWEASMIQPALDERP